MIALQVLSDIGRESLVNLLLDEKTQPFKIGIYKGTVQFSTAPSEIAYDYARLAYSGQQLSDIAQEFAYEKITPDVREFVVFTVRTDDIDRLADTLLSVAFLYGYRTLPGGDDAYEEAELDRQESISDFLSQVDKGTIIPACSYFIQLYNEFSEEDEEDDWDE